MPLGTASRVQVHDDRSWRKNGNSSTPSAGIGAHVYHSLDGGETMQDITEAVAHSEGINIGGHTPVPYFTGGAALLAFDNGQVAINRGNARCNQWLLLAQLPGAVLSLSVDSRMPSSVIH